MNKTIFSIPDMSCGHCTSSIEKGLMTIDGITNVHSNLEDKTTTVEYRGNVTIPALIEALDDIGFEAKEI